MYALQTMLNIFFKYATGHARGWMNPNVRASKVSSKNILHGDNGENLLKNQFSYCHDEKQTGFQMKTLSFQQC